MELDQQLVELQVLATRLWTTSNGPLAAAELIFEVCSCKDIGIDVRSVYSGSFGMFFGVFERSNDVCGFIHSLIVLLLSRGQITVVHFQHYLRIP